MKFRLFALVVIVSLFLIASSQLIAELISIRPINQIERNEEKQIESTDLSVEKLKSRLRTSNSLNSYNSKYIFFEARILLNSTSLTEKDFGYITSLLDQVISQSPTWHLPHCYKVIAMNKVYSSQPSIITLNYLQQALNNALQLSLYEVETQRLLLPIIFENWEILEKENKILAEKMAVHALETNNARKLHVLLSIIEHNLMEEFLPLINDKWQRARIMKELTLNDKG
ncbi:hypothetical protein [Aliiglaciecola lipolytica]|uniref:hypothetical protein n=1 Tax=Aliiglaciecola lipolytica TaxID=477689 RepID=UPI001C088841|nr:hypothetical protein [Aliiglaciecola lipolytica]MBU2880296.1 hypothetical protein [Aliiglaciecola lipolytica]